MAKEKTMNDYIIQDKIDRQIKEGEPKDTHYMETEDGLIIPEEDYIEEAQKEQDRVIKLVTAYNNDIHKLDPNYSERIVPVNGKILVRTYVINPVSDGVFVGFGYKFIKKKGEEYKHEAIPNPLPYADRAVIVAVEENEENYKVGEEIQLHPNATRLELIQGTQSFIGANTFERHDAKFNSENPYEHFGYLMIRPGDIQCKLK